MSGQYVNLREGFSFYFKDGRLSQYLSIILATYMYRFTYVMLWELITGEWEIYVAGDRGTNSEARALERRKEMESVRLFNICDRRKHRA